MLLPGQVDGLAYRAEDREQVSIKTLLYVALALGICYGLLKLAWNVSESVLKPDDQEISQPQQVEPSSSEPKLQTGTAAGGIEAGEDVVPEGKAAATPGVEIESKVETEAKSDTDAADDGYYDDGVQSTSGPVKQHRSDAQAPYAPDASDASEEEAASFPTDDREIDRTQPAKPEKPAVNPEAFAPDPHEVD